MTVHRDKFLVNETNRHTEFQFYWYYDSTCFGQHFCPSSGVLSRTSALVHFMQIWLPFATRNRMELWSRNTNEIRIQCFCWFRSYSMKYLLTAIRLSPGGSSTVHIYTQTIHRTKQNKQYTEQHNNLGECGLCPVLARSTLAFVLQLRKKHGKTTVRLAASKNT